MFSWQLLSLGEHPASAKSSNRTARAEQKKPAHESSCALAKGTICFALCQQNFLMWRESFPIRFQHLNVLLGFWACCVDTGCSGMCARQRLCGEETNERVRLSSRRPSPRTPCRRAPPPWGHSPPFGGDTQAAPKGSEWQRKAGAPCTPGQSRSRLPPLIPLNRELLVAAQRESQETRSFSSLPPAPRAEHQELTGSNSWKRGPLIKVTKF